MKSLELLKEAKTRIVREIVSKHGTMAKTLENDSLNIIEARDIVYEVINSIAQGEFHEEFR